MERKIYIMDSFVKDQSGGNPAGVVLGSNDLSERQMLEIAAKVGVSETAFVQREDADSFNVRFFTPCSEVKLCGHATIAVFSLLKSRGIIGNGAFLQKTKAGVLAVTVSDDGIYMNQVLPQYLGILDKAEIEESLNISLGDYLPSLPIQIVSTGLKDVLIPVKHLEVLCSIKPNLAKIKELSIKHDIIGFHVFSLETKFGSTAHCRNFAPLYGINEESATGTSNGALACYLHTYNIINKANTECIFEQGYSMGKPSEIIVRLKVDKGKIHEVQVGGKAIYRNELEIKVT